MSIFKPRQAVQEPSVITLPDLPSCTAKRLHSVFLMVPVVLCSPSLTLRCLPSEHANSNDQLCPFPCPRQASLVAWRRTHIRPFGILSWTPHGHHRHHLQANAILLVHSTTLRPVPHLPYMAVYIYVYLYAHRYTCIHRVQGVTMGGGVHCTGWHPSTMHRSVWVVALFSCVFVNNTVSCC